jgi:deoxycytidine triphosphate deaminase
VLEETSQPSNASSLVPTGKGGVLTISELREENMFYPEAQGEIYDECFSNASFDFTLGDEYFFPKVYQDALNHTRLQKGLTNVRDLPTPDVEKVLEATIRKCSERDNVLIIPKFSSVVISTYESVKLPNNIAGRFDLRVRWAMAGLVLQVGTQIEPGYDGRLWGLLHNFSGEDIMISFHSKDHRLLTAEFYYTCRETPPTLIKRNKPKTLLDLLLKYPVKSGSLQNSFERFGAMYTEAKQSIDNEIEALRTFREVTETRITNEIDLKSNEVRQLRNETDNLNTRVQNSVDRVNDQRINRTSITLIIVTFIISLGLPVLVSKLTFDKDDYISFERAKEFKAELNSLRVGNDSLKAENQRLQEDINSLKKNLKQTEGKNSQ